MSLQISISSILSGITVPALGKTLTSLPVKPIVTLENKILKLELISDFPHRFLQEQVEKQLAHELMSTFEEYEIQLGFTTGIRAHKTQMPGKGLKQVKNVITIASGKGGVGKSTVTVNLAAALVKAGAKVGVLDADIYGPSIPLMLGASKPVEVKNEKYIPVKAHGIQAMSIGYLTKNEPALIWRGPMLAKSLLQMLDITEWDDLDYLFIDLPPGTGDIQLSLVQKIPVTGAIVVSTPQSVATLDAEKAIKMFEKTNIEILGMIENMSTHVCPQCNFEESIFGSGGAEDIARTHSVPFLGRLPLNQKIMKDCDKGTPTATENIPLSKTFESVAFNATYVLSEKALNYADKMPPVIIEK